eukprot:CAMPEP_0206248228 /NCGR_PEP_ID=MMETSP0047_2-20121206/20255_1 /ASSEMBLY_ACC=CAM_ASM_000192 /TAXON_ID=195065 /ORGANISM="Chroomonas mesostigmatica_cf, Strain CCMP1168" /LENGTH=134 /DNA_ID=CAMNT_0053673853 /DNA_START=30 /DNA_END=434 /DNA_ORIENTATION=-
MRSGERTGDEGLVRMQGPHEVIQGAQDACAAPRECCCACGSQIEESCFFGHDRKFCTEGCRCAFSFNSFASEEDLLAAGEACVVPCLHCDATCPHLSSGAPQTMKRNKFGFKKFICHDDEDWCGATLLRPDGPC